jgi:hypothetical protein
VTGITHLSFSNPELLFVLTEIEVAREFVGKRGFVIDEAFEMDARYLSIG